jgi:oligopeptide transport system substrate-binding protein
MNRNVLALFGAIAILVIIIGVMAIILLGGGGDDGGTPGQRQDGTTSTRADLRLLGGEPLTMDPAIAQETSSGFFIVEVFGGLVTIDRNLQVVPDLAERWEISEDGRVYTFHIRRDALFHNGKQVRAQDFKYSLERALNPRTQSTVAEAYLGDIVGARDMSRGRANSVSGIEVVDDSTLRITIDSPKAYFLAKLTYPTAFVVDQQQIETNPRNWERRPNGTGPYKMINWTLGERIILEANERYHLGAPAVKRILFNLAGGSSLTQYENGEVDVAGIGLNDIERVQSPRDPLSREYKTGGELTIWYIGFNTQLPPFDDPKVREAFFRAIDRDRITRVVLKDLYKVANSYMQPGLPGYNENARLPEFNPELARQLLAESKYGSARGLGQVKLTQVGAGASGGSFDVQAMLSMWQENLGVEVTIDNAESAAFFDDLDRGRFQMFFSGWIMDYPDPENIIDLLFHSASRQNHSRYSNPAFDALVEAARTERDVQRRLQMYQEAEQILIKDLPWMPLYFGADHFVVKPYVKGWEPTPILYPRLRYLSIER